MNPYNIPDRPIPSCVDNCVKRFDASDADADRYFDEEPDRY